MTDHPFAREYVLAKQLAADASQPGASLEQLAAEYLHRYRIECIGGVDVAAEPAARKRRKR